MSVSSDFNNNLPFISCLEDLGAELIYIQDRSGRYISFFWQGASQYGINTSRVLQDLEQNMFTPVAQEEYKKIIGKILDQKIPQQAYWHFSCLEHYLPFELMITPIISREGKAESVLVMGVKMSSSELNQTMHSPLAIQRDPYQKLLNNVVRKIRRTLNLETIWQETVDGIGETLKVDRALLIYCNSQEKQLEVKAEYLHSSDLISLRGCFLNFDLMPYLRTAMVCKEPFVIEGLTNGKLGENSVLVISTFYQDQHNGLICLQRCGDLNKNTQPRNWTKAEVELVQKIADQVGTAIAHGTLYHELEEARKKAEEASRLKSEFLRNTSHELRTPLNSIIGFLQFILQGLVDEPEQQREFIELSYNSSLYLLNLIDDLLDIAKIESGKMELELTTIALKEVFEKVEEITRTQTESKGLSLSFKMPSTYEEVVLYSNYKSLIQVMLNLVGNSIKFTHKGGIKVNARIVIDSNKPVKYKEQEFPGYVEISVADTGIGVPLDKQDKIFESFVQTDGSRTRAYSGTGLGLAISKKLVEAIGGKISFYSLGEGLGAIVIFTVILNHIPVLKTVENLQDVDQLAT